MYVCWSNDQRSASPLLQKYPEQCWLVGDQKSLQEQRSVMPAQAVLQQRAITICIISLWKYFWSVGRWAKVTLILQLRGDRLQMSSQKHTPLTFPCWSTICLQTGMRSMNGNRRACHPGGVKPRQNKWDTMPGGKTRAAIWSREAAAAESTGAPSLHTCKRQGLFYPGTSSLPARLRVIVQVDEANHIAACCKVRISCTVHSCIFTQCLLSVWPKYAFNLNTRLLPGLLPPGLT